MWEPRQRLPPFLLPGHAEGRARRMRMIAIGETLVDTQAQLRALAHVPAQRHAGGGGAVRQADAVHRRPLRDARIARREHLALRGERVLPAELAVEMQLAYRGQPRSAGAQTETRLPA